MRGLFEAIAGAAMIAAAIVFPSPASGYLISAGAGLVLTGVGTMIAGNGPVKGFATAVRNSIAPWRVLVGRVRTGGTVVYLHQWGSNNQMLDMVIVLASHSCAIDAGHPITLLFDMQRIQIDTTAKPAGAPALAGSSFTPVQQTQTISRIARVGDVVTVELAADIPYLIAGDQVQIKDVPGDTTLNGIVQVAEIVQAPSTHVGGAVGAGTLPLKFTFLSGGPASTVVSAGHCVTRWADYGRNVYLEYLDGTQTLGQTFKGMTLGTPWQGSGPLVRPELPGLAGASATPVNVFGGEQNPWTSDCSLQGKTAVFLRMRYDKDKFPSGLPQISFLLYGKNDIYDPRTSPPSHGYSENAALVIADYLSTQSYWGYRAVYGTDIPIPELIAAANVCDEAVPLANGGTEPRYACCGSFEVSTKRGEVLQNLLTSCGARLLYLGGKYIIQPAQWSGPGSPPVAVDLMAIAAGAFRWRPTTPSRDLFNGAKGTYISPENKWQATDFPAYAQDTLHGYAGPLAYGGDILLAADGGERRWLELHFPFTISAATAQRLAKIELLRRRGRAGTAGAGSPPAVSAGNGGTGTFFLNLAGLQFAPLDVFQATVAFFGWSGKLLEVAAVRPKVEEVGEGDRKLSRVGIEIDVAETDSSIYQWSDEEELSPQGYQQTEWPRVALNQPAPLPWSPGYATPGVGDALGGAATFGLQPLYGRDAQDNATAALQIQGTPPANALDLAVASPQVRCTPSTSGGSIAAGTYVMGVAAFDSGSADAALTEYLALEVVEVGGSGAGSIVAAMTWGSGDDGGELYMGRWSAAGFTMHKQATLTPGQATATITGFDETTHGGPDPLFSRFGVAWQQVRHSGIFAAQVVARTATTITLASVVAADIAIDEFAGRVLTLLAKLDATVEVPVLNLRVASHTASAGTPALYVITVGVGADGSMPPDLTTVLAAGDLLVMRPNCTFTDTGFSDAGYANAYAPTGADPAAEAGAVAIVLTGPDAGDVQSIETVLDSGGGLYTDWKLAGRWAITPNAGDLVIVCEAGQRETPSDAMQARNESATAKFAVRVDNLVRATWLFRVRTEDAAGASGPDAAAPCREVYLFGAREPVSSTSVVDGYFDLTPDAFGNVAIDLANGLNQRLVLDGTPVTVVAPVFTGGAIIGGSWFALYLVQDATGGRAAASYQNGVTGSFAVDEGLAQLDGRAGYATLQQFTYHGAEDRWGLDFFREGVALS